MGKWVKFRIGRKIHFGKILSIEHEVANIRGFEQKKKEKAAYHYPLYEIIEATHDEVFNLGRAAINLLR